MQISLKLTKIHLGLNNEVQSLNKFDSSRIYRFMIKSYRKRMDKTTNLNSLLFEPAFLIKDSQMQNVR